MESKVCSRSQGQPPGAAQPGHDFNEMLKFSAGGVEAFFLQVSLM